MRRVTRRHSIGDKSRWLASGRRSEYLHLSDESGFRTIAELRFGSLLMGPSLLTNAALTGFFLFAAIYHLILWSQARQNRTLLLFAIVTLLSSFQTVVIATIASTQNLDTAQLALNTRGHIALATVIG